MAKIKKLTPADVSAVLSNAAVVRKYRNQLVLTKLTQPRKSKSEKKLEANERFKEANDYAKRVLEKPGLKELYAKGIRNKHSSAHVVAVRDYMTAPQIHYIQTEGYTGALGCELRIKATDDFEVTAVEVSIHDARGKLLEKGAAERSKRKPSMWYYRTTVANPEVKGTIIKVTASDRPGNKTKGEVVCEGK